ncbi:MAG: hypothetical protein AB8F95_19825 [Bacteroidia bacterium]
MRAWKRMWLGVVGIMTKKKAFTLSDGSKYFN